MEQKQVTLGIIKPDAVEREGVANAIKTAISINGLEIQQAHERMLTLEEAKALYAPHKDKPFFQDLCKQMTDNRVILLLIRGTNGVRSFRDLIFKIRPVFAQDEYRNSIHASDSIENANRETSLFFNKELSSTS